MLKLALLFSNAIPLIFSESMAPHSKRSRGHRSCEIEKVLSIRACNVGGMGTSSMYEHCSSKSDTPLEILNSYELVRLGYVVVGDRYLISWEDWGLLLVIGPFRRLIKWRNRRIMVFKMMDCGDRRGCHNAQISKRPEMVSVADFLSLCSNWWDIDSRSFQ